LEVGVVFVELAFLFLGEGRTVRELVADGPRPGLFFASSFDQLDFDFRFPRGLRTVHETLGQYARRVFRADSPRLNHGQSDFSGCGSVG
jgi:hypothetical protein